MSTSALTESPWARLAEDALAGAELSRDQFRSVLHAGPDQLLAVLDAAFIVRRAYHGRRVQIHVLENAKMGACPEDCGFCSQSARFGSPSGEAPMKTVEELVAGARRAREKGARRYCMVTATRGPSSRDLDTICEATRRIKAEMDIDICASLGLLTQDKATRLRSAGVDRFNHNLETSRSFFDTVVSTHTYDDRMSTLRHARDAGMSLCSGGIVGLGETESDLIDLAFALREVQADSVPVNFLDPRPGTPLRSRERISPERALLVLCAFRFLHPRADLRVAGGREVTLRSLQPMALYPANSIFTTGYLTTGGNQADTDHDMIRDLGFEIEVTGGRHHSGGRARYTGSGVGTVVRINRVYTRGGDAGETSLIGGDRASKASLRVDCYGTVDELNAALGLVRTSLATSPARDALLPIVARIQNELFNLGAELATPDPDRRARSPQIEERHVTALERDIDGLNQNLPDLKSFVLPGGGVVSSYFHLARTICRRAERMVVAASQEEDLGKGPLIYLNRLSDALFVFGRYAATAEGQDEPLWDPAQT